MELRSVNRNGKLRKESHGLTKSVVLNKNCITKPKIIIGELEL
jgi:hypothetical protein